MPSVVERRRIMEALWTANGTPEEFDPEDEYDIVMGWMLMDYLADWIERDNPPAALAADGSVKP